MFMQRNVAYLLLIVMLGLIAMGLVMLSSTSASAANMTAMHQTLIPTSTFTVTLKVLMIIVEIP